MSGTITFCISAETENEIHDAIERIINTIETECPDIAYSVSEDTWDEND